MIFRENIDIFKNGDLTHIVHQANLYHVFGSGIAAKIKSRFPQAYVADCRTNNGDRLKLGSFSSAQENGRTIINLYSQIGIGGKDRHTSYDAMHSGLSLLERRLSEDIGPVIITLGIPYGMGCGLANGSWRVVEAIIEDVFDKSHVRVVICRLPSQ